MGYQGTRRAAGPGTGAQRIAAAGTGAQPVAGPGTGGQPVLGTGTGGQSVLRTGSGAQPVLRTGSGAQPVLRTGSGAQPVLRTGTGGQSVLEPGTGGRSVLEPGTGGQPVLGPGTGGRSVLEPGTGGQPVLGPGTGGRSVLEPGTGAQPTLTRTPVRGFPPAPPGRVPAPDPFGPAPRPAAPPPVEDAGHAAEGGNGRYPPDKPDADAQVAPTTRRHGPKTARPRRRFSRIAWLAAACLVVAAGGFAGYKYLYEPRVNAPVSPTLRLPTTAPVSPGFDQALGKWQHIGTRTEDPDPLTLTELYPPQFELDGSSYTRTAASSTKNCTQVVYGSQLQTALQSGHCTQVLRASYVSGDGTMMGTIGVVNLSTSGAAQSAGEATGPQEIIAPLTGQKGSTSKLGNGTGIVQAEIKGHYLILMWAEFADLKSPSTSAQKRQLEQFATDLVTGSANIDLSTRMLTGKA